MFAALGEATLLRKVDKLYEIAQAFVCSAKNTNITGAITRTDGG